MDGNGRDGVRVRNTTGGVGDKVRRGPERSRGAACVSGKKEEEEKQHDEEDDEEAEESDVSD